MYDPCQRGRERMEERMRKRDMEEWRWGVREKTDEGERETERGIEREEEKVRE